MNNPAELDNIINCWKPKDVIFGRGSGSNNHEGNIQFCSQINSQKGEYRESKYTLDKRKLCARL